ncbi:DnaJ-like protein subfamily C member 2 [Aphelenchoides besseyi]|nr:DnaJ-like protein subfamily C member 2 [Aphelenchoides besseyi]KAI6229311.1 DnaJ-like protein subfamily C member 2 [Aphelenchoides besseyi]
MALALPGFRPLQRRRIEFAGIAYECNATLDRMALGLSVAPVLKVTASACSSTGSSSDDLCAANPDEFMDKDDEKYYRYVAKLDPNNFKDQDHYKVLGLSKLRYKATFGQIKTAYRQKVLVYHPDKGKATKNGSRNEEIFACIQKAYEQLGMDEDKRRAYDSVDPKFDDTFPETSAVNTENFFDVLGPVFERNSRFSTSTSVPQLGDLESKREDVERFYDFWLHFKSWREFSYNDKEDKSRGEDRYERREIEKMNRIEREQLRKKYVKKLSSMVELAYGKDPRVQMFKEQDKRAKEEGKERRRLEKQRVADEAEARRLEAERKAEAELQEQREAEKLANLEKRQAKKQLQTERRRLRDLIKSKGYFTKNEQQRLEVMEHLEGACLNLSFEELVELTNKIETVTDLANALQLLSVKKEENNSTKLENNTTKIDGTNSVKVIWETDEIQLLIKATNIFPAGSVERWTQVTKYINDHSKNGETNPKKEKDVIKEVKLMKSAEATATLANVLQRQPAGIQNEPTIETKTADVEVWSAAQQKQLESALKSIDSKDPQRWEKIAEKVDGKTKKQCMQRYKKLVQMVKEGKTVA